MKLLTLAHQSFTDTKKGPQNCDPSVIRLGLEPRTPTLKVLCSTS